MPKILKKVYFIRHAQTDGNAGDIQMGEESKLTENGLKQAELVATRFKNQKIDTFILSPTPRAVHTAKIINQYHNLELYTHPCLIERRRPSILYGVNKNDPQRLAVNQSIYDNFAKDGFRHSDEENFEILNNRAGEILDLINTTKGENIVCVTHGYIMRIVIAKILFEEKLTGVICKEFVRTMHLENTGIVEVNQGEDGKWFLWRWNDFSHLQTT